jgi:CBS domain-containing protein
VSAAEGQGTPVAGSNVTPSLRHARVADAMRPGVITCPPDSSMRDVARMMVTNHIHAVVVRGVKDSGGWGVVTDRDLLATAPGADNAQAGACASELLVTVAPDEPLEAACELMRAHGVSHVMVVDPQQNQPLGVVSTLDVAGIVAWGQA